MSYVIIPPMPVTGTAASCPEVHFQEATLEELRLIAHACAEIAATRDPMVRYGLCHVVNEDLGYCGASAEFCCSVTGALAGYEYLREYLTEVCDAWFYGDAMLEIRWAWAAHIARSIYEQIGS